MAAKQKAVAYLRVSGKGQVEGDGFDRQRDKIAKYAKANGIEIVEEFRDEGVSGEKELANREGLAACMDRVSNNGVKLVLVECADRLARDSVVQELIVREFQKAGVKVLSADGDVDLTKGNKSDPTTKLIRQILAAIAEFDRDVIVLKLRAARVRIRRTEGRCEGRKPYGTKDGEAAVLDRILEMRRGARGRERTSFADIAEQLNADGMPTRQGGKWKPGTVYKLVNDHAPRLTGRD